MSRIQSRLADKDTEHRKDLAQAESQAATKAAELEKQMGRLQSQISAKETEHNDKVAQVRKTLEQEAERVQRRADAGLADLKATISRLEVDLMKANKSKTHDLQAAKEGHAKALQAAKDELAKQVAKTEQSEAQNKELESQLDESRAINEDMRSDVTKVSHPPRFPFHAMLKADRPSRRWRKQRRPRTRRSPSSTTYSRSLRTLRRRRQSTR